MTTVSPAPTAAAVADPEPHLAVLRGELDRTARETAELETFVADDRDDLAAVDDPRALAEVGARHERYDGMARLVDARDLDRLRTHHSPLLDVTDALRGGLHRLDAPRLRVFGTSDYRYGWTWRSDHRFQDTTDLLQDTLEQDESYDLARGTVHLRHRLSNHRSEIKSFLGFPYRPNLAVGYADIRPYFRYSVGGWVDALDTLHWPGGTADRCRSYTYGEIYLTSTAADGSDARTEGPVRVRSTYDAASQGSFHSIGTDGVLTVGDGLHLEAVVIDSRSYIVWVGAYAWAWSRIVPRLATSQVLAVDDASVPFVVVEERPIA
ncbi:hypothetical protein [Nakamurella endophytica]|uniref:Uncharacterized protein n=1 Tax=Nakamurella endophytica TaxID=1748367 RepID=A0A917SW63_9ACTN|nr:hypothetical protein [Nakamurella endophytica]GGM00831.1 hypothetical protein GCM10011594_21100 [Nakamurella endophytica]